MCFWKHIVKPICNRKALFWLQVHTVRRNAQNTKNHRNKKPWTSNLMKDNQKQKHDFTCSWRFLNVWSKNREKQHCWNAVFVWCSFICCFVFGDVCFWSFLNVFRTFCWTDQIKSKNTSQNHKHNMSDSVCVILWCVSGHVAQTSCIALILQRVFSTCGQKIQKLS